MSGMRWGDKEGGAEIDNSFCPGGAEARLVRIISKITTMVSAKNKRYESAVGDSWGGLSAKCLPF